ncbi:hypothetical protein [Nocardia exalbida]|uniref:hypothetical protein n=1 Tax=Nocardia exalbida TaxID=290231 RepID=UPI0012F6DF0D|nr:hypothetical protein [Nocardia exalbida]
MKYSFAAALATAALLCVPSFAAAEPNPADLEFTASSAYREYQNNIATFTGQVNYSSNVFAWSLKLLPATQNIVYGGMNCHTTIGGIAGYSDDHQNIPRDYLLHSSIKIDRGRWHKLRSRCDFKVLTDAGMQPGDVETSVDFIAR